MSESGPVSPPPAGIVYVITSLAMGGAQNVLLQLLAGRPADYEPLCVVTLRREQGVEEKVRAAGIKVLHLELNKPWRVPVNLLRMWRYLRNRPVKILFSIMPHANLLAALLQVCSGRRWRLIWNLHNTPDSGLYRRRDHRFIMWLSYRLAQSLPEKIIVVSERSRARYLALGYPADKLVLIQNGVAVDEYSVAQQQAVSRQVRNALGLDHDAVLIGSLTRYVPAKNIPLLLEALQLLMVHSQSVSGRAVYLLLAGENMSADNTELQQLLTRYQLTQRVLLLGIRTDAADLIRALDIATLSSVSESLPLFMVEAMAAGVPCVATDVGDIATLFADTGQLVPPGQPQLLAEAWRAVLEMPEHARQENITRARQRISSDFSVRQMLVGYGEVLRGRSD
jgi:glycosyltransferase involved in cell wall biosynthesis